MRTFLELLRGTIPTCKDKVCKNWQLSQSILTNYKLDGDKQSDDVPNEKSDRKPKGSNKIPAVTSDKLYCGKSNDNDPKETIDQGGYKKPNDAQQKETSYRDGNTKVLMFKIESESDTEYSCYIMTTILDHDEMMKIRKLSKSTYSFVMRKHFGKYLPLLCSCKMMKN